MEQNLPKEVMQAIEKEAKKADNASGRSFMIAILTAGAQLYHEYVLSRAERLDARIDAFLESHLNNVSVDKHSYPPELTEHEQRKPT